MVGDRAKKDTRQIASLPVLRTRSTDEAVVVQVYPPGINLGRRQPLLAAGTVVGRLPECDLSIDEDSVSRRHAQLVYHEATWYLQDLDSTNGCFVNDDKVTRTILRDGDLIRFGVAIYKFLTGSNIETAYHEEIYRTTIIDGLTGVHNRRFFLDFLEREMARARRYPGPLGLVMMDVDHFKQVNDSYGHLAGDAVLRELGRRLRPRIRREDLLARYGGEEFVFVLTGTGREGVVSFAGSIRQLIAAQPFRHEGNVFPVTVSIGLAVFDGRDGKSSAESFIEAADRNLYKAKQEGRDRVVG
jgi:diguanylate cyclase (GGDEF)-like protein